MVERRQEGAICVAPATAPASELTTVESRIQGHACAPLASTHALQQLLPHASSSAVPASRSGSFAGAAAGAGAGTGLAGLEAAALGAAAAAPPLLAGAAAAAAGTAAGTDVAEAAFFRPNRSSKALAPRSLQGGEDARAHVRQAVQGGEERTLQPCCARRTLRGPKQYGPQATFKRRPSSAQPGAPPHLRRAASSATSRLPGSAPPPTSALRHAACCCWLLAAPPSPVSRVQAPARRSTGGCSRAGRKDASRNSSERSPLRQAGRAAKGWGSAPRRRRRSSDARQPRPCQKQRRAQVAVAAAPSFS